MNELTHHQKQILYSAVRQYQIEHMANEKLYEDCHEILNILYDFVYTQRKEQVR